MMFPNNKNNKRADIVVDYWNEKERLEQGDEGKRVREKEKKIHKNGETRNNNVLNTIINSKNVPRSSITCLYCIISLEAIYNFDVDKLMFTSELLYYDIAGGLDISSGIRR